MTGVGLDYFKMSTVTEKQSTRDEQVSASVPSAKLSVSRLVLGMSGAESRSVWG